MIDRINQELPKNGTKAKKPSRSKIIHAVKPLYIRVRSYCSARTSNVPTSNKIMAGVAGCLLVLAAGVALSLTTTAAGSPAYAPNGFDQDRTNDRLDENRDILGMTSSAASPSLEEKRSADRFDENRDILTMGAGVANLTYEAQRAADRLEENLDIILQMQSGMVSPSGEAQRTVDRREENLDILEGQLFAR